MVLALQNFILFFQLLEAQSISLYISYWNSQYWLNNNDFSSLKTESTGGRPSIDYILKLEIAKEICLVAGASPKPPSIVMTFL